MKDKPDFQAMKSKGKILGSIFSAEELWNTRTHSFKIQIAVDSNVDERKQDAVINAFLGKISNMKVSVGNMVLFVKNVKYLKERKQ